MAMLPLDEDWLKLTLATCPPSIPKPKPLPGLGKSTNVSKKEENVLKTYYGSTGDRYSYALEIFRLVKTCTRNLACNLDFSVLCSSS